MEHRPLLRREGIAAEAGCGREKAAAAELDQVHENDNGIPAGCPIIDWNESRGYTLQTVWPKQELERLLTN